MVECGASHARKTIGEAEIVLGSGPADGWKLTITVDEKFGLALAKPTIAELPPGQKSSDIAALAANTVKNHMGILDAGVGPPPLGVK